MKYEDVKNLVEKSLKKDPLCMSGFTPPPYCLKIYPHYSTLPQSMILSVQYPNIPKISAMPKPFSLRSWTKRKQDDKIENRRFRNIEASIHNSVPKQDGHALEANRTSQKEPEIIRYGLFLLNKNIGNEAQKYNIDIVAVHGLGGNAYGTWTHDNGKLWLRDLLLEDLPGARVFTYGYNSTFVFSRETGNLRSYARELLENVRSERTHPEV